MNKNTNRTRPKFKVGQIVAIRSAVGYESGDYVVRVLSFDGIFYRLNEPDNLNWRETELRRLTKRERG